MSLISFKIAFICFLATSQALERKELIETLKFRPSKITKEFVLRNNAKMSDEFHNPNEKDKITQLAYVTPWNNKGYDLAIETAHKLTHVSPVWFQVKPFGENSKTETCKIEGLHDVKREWMEALIDKNRNIKIVPRILFDNWSAPDMRLLFENVYFAEECFSVITDFYSRNGFHGAVVEFYMQALIATQALEAKDYIIESMKHLSKMFKKYNHIVVYTVPAPLEWNNSPNKLVTPQDLRRIQKFSDYVQIMTYDYRGTKISGVAPYDWFEECIFYLNGEPSKTLAGLNYYGYEFSKGKMDAITSERYLEALREKSSIIEFDESSMEHRLKTSKSIIYYPSLSSLELRINLAHRYGLGFAVWDYGQGLDHFTNLLV